MWHYSALYMLLIMAYYDNSIAIVQRQHDMYHCNDNVHIQSTRQAAGLSGSDSRRLACSWRWENCLGPQFLPVVCFVFRRSKFDSPRFIVVLSSEFVIVGYISWVYLRHLFVADDWWLEQIKLAAAAQDDLPDKRMGCQALHADSRGYLSLPILHLDYGWSWVSKYEYEVSKQFQQQFIPNICTILHWFASRDSGCQRITLAFPVPTSLSSCRQPCCHCLLVGRHTLWMLGLRWSLQSLEKISFFSGIHPLVTKPSSFVIYMLYTSTILNITKPSSFIEGRS